jgi:hypothetical protein
MQGTANTTQQRRQLGLVGSGHHPVLGQLPFVLLMTWPLHI